jgi:hypothetical protein
MSKPLFIFSVDLGRRRLTSVFQVLNYVSEARNQPRIVDAAEAFRVLFQL